MTRLIGLAVFTSLALAGPARADDPPLDPVVLEGEGSINNVKLRTATIIDYIDVPVFGIDLGLGDGSALVCEYNEDTLEVYVDTCDIEYPEWELES